MMPKVPVPKPVPGDFERDGASDVPRGGSGAPFCAHGLMGGCGHLKQGTPDAPERFSRLETLLHFEMKTIHTSIATHKSLLKRQGIFTGSHVRAPGAELNEAQRSELEQILENLR